MSVSTGMAQLGTQFKWLGYVWVLVAFAAEFWGADGVPFGLAAVALWTVGWGLQRFDKHRGR